MVELRVLSGASKGRAASIAKFPFLIGRSPQAGLLLSDPGVWERHAILSHNSDHRFMLRPEPGAAVSIDGKVVTEHALRNGDRFDCGAARLVFWIAPARSRSLRLQETGLWLGIAAVVLMEISLILALTR